MAPTLSILLPSYNNTCLALVEALHAQASALRDFRYEILVADDGSTDKMSVKTNRRINDLPNCRYIEREKNVGRAIIRNFLAKQAQGRWLLYIDSDMEVRNPLYITNYVSILRKQETDEKTHPDIIYGGYTIANADEKALSNNLRYISERQNRQNADHTLRQSHPYRDFHTSNFIVRREIMLQYPLDERFRHYGYEDVLWGKTLQTHNISILHVDNPLNFEHFETNMTFLDKTEEALHTLYHFREDLSECSTLIRYANMVCRIPLAQHAIRKTFPFISLHIKSKLMGPSPNVLLFNIYKLMYFVRLMQ